MISGSVGPTGGPGGDNSQYVLVDGSRALTAPIEGVDPTSAAHLATRGYVDGIVAGLTFLTAENIDTLSEINAILGDATLITDTDSRLSDARDWTADLVSQSEAEAGTSTIARKWSAQRVRQAIEALASIGLSVDHMTGNFTASPGKIYTVSLAAGDVVATVPNDAGACSIVVTEPGTSGGAVAMVAHCESVTNNTTPTASGGTLTTANVTAITPTKKFGSASLQLAHDNGVVNLGQDATAGDFTVDYWLYVEFDRDGRHLLDGAFDIVLQSDGTVVVGSGAGVAQTSAGAIGTDLWVHIAVVYDAAADTLTLYIDGVSVATATGQTPSSSDLSIQSASSIYVMLVDEIRWSTEKAYTANFTPPTSAYTEVGGAGSANTLTVAGTAISFTAAGDRVDFQSDGTYKVSQTVGGATTAQGVLADTAVQPSDLASGAITPASGDLDLSNLGGGLSGLGSTDHAIPRTDGTGGDTLQGSGVTIDDLGNVAIPHNSGVGTSAASLEFNDFGKFRFGGTTNQAVLYQGDLSLKSGGCFGWKSDEGNADSGTKYAGLACDSAGVVRISDGSTGRGNLLVDLFQLDSYTLATLPDAATYDGYESRVSDPATGKGARVYSDGTDWRYISDDSIAEPPATTYLDDTFDADADGWTLANSAAWDATYGETGGGIRLRHYQQGSNSSRMSKDVTTSAAATLTLRHRHTYSGYNGGIRILINGVEEFAYQHTSGTADWATATISLPTPGTHTILIDADYGDTDSEGFSYIDDVLVEAD